ncbi:hypothetical protein lerEdw1_007249 [Lerista edwardsae]|nr:hypothetical protein lerEdw1_007249 [Lerista edwardsae]
MGEGPRWTAPISSLAPGKAQELPVPAKGQPQPRRSPAEEGRAAPRLEGASATAPTPGPAPPAGTAAPLLDGRPRSALELLRAAAPGRAGGREEPAPLGPPCDPLTDRLPRVASALGARLPGPPPQAVLPGGTPSDSIAGRSFLLHEARQASSKRQAVVPSSGESAWRQESGSGVMAHSGFGSCSVQRCGALTVTFANDLAPRGKRPLQDFPGGDQPLQLDAKRPCWERLHSSPPHSQKMPQSSRAAAPASSPSWDDGNLDASLLEPSDGEEPDSPWGLSPEAEAKLLEDDPGEEEDVDPFPPFEVFGVDAETVESSCAPASPEAAQPSSVSWVLEKTTCAKPLPLPSPSDLCSGGLACRSGSVAPEHESYIHRDTWNRAGLGPCSSTPAFAETGPFEAPSVRPEGEGSALTEEDAAQAGRDNPAAGQLTAGVSDMAEGPINRQASISQEQGRGERAGHPPPEELEAPPVDSAGNQSAALVEKPSTRRPNSPPRPRQRIHIQQADLERSMQNYLNTVLAHVHCHSPGMGPVNELHALMQRVSAEDHSQGRAFRHPADLTMRNYAERANRPARKCTLGQWVVRNQRSRPLFADVPDRFKRSPIPSL